MSGQTSIYVIIMEPIEERKQICTKSPWFSACSDDAGWAGRTAARHHDIRDSRRNSFLSGEPLMVSEFIHTGDPPSAKVSRSAGCI